MIILNYIYRGKFSTKVFVQPCSLISKFKKRWFTHDYCGTQLTRTNIFMQEGKHIQEVPLIVRKITNIEALFGNESKEDTSISDKNKKSTIIYKEDIPRFINTNVMKTESLKHSISIETNEGTAILFYPNIERLRNTDVEQVLDTIRSGSTNKEMYPLKKDKTADEMSCRIAFQNLKKIIDLENGWYRYRKTLTSGQSSAEIVNRNIILRQLVHLIVKSRDSEMILQGLRALKRDRFSPSMNVYKDLMCNEVMIRATDGKFSVSQLIRAVKILASLRDSKYRNCVDMLWIGLACREQDIKSDLLVPLFRFLKYFQQSKDMVQIILEKKLSEQWLKLSGTQMANILDCFHGKECPKGCLSSASKWAGVSMTTSTEKDLVNFISGLRAKKYIDENIEQAMARYITTRSTETKDSNLIASIMDYCKDLRVRNPYILAECGKYFIRHGMEISPTLLSSILTPFGLLNVQPPDPTEFWKIFNKVISARFADLKLNDALDILLSCMYLEKYPIKYLDRIFSSYLVNRLEIQREFAPSINCLKTKLKLFDASMSLECKDYQGDPINLDRSAKSLNLDMRIRGIVNKIYKPLAHLVGDEQKLSRNVILNKLPLINFYILDILVHPFLKSTSVFNLNLHKKRNANTAILIQLPEYYCWNTRFLIGPQIMRKRQIRKLGFRVTCLDYAKLAKLVDHDDKLLSYLSQSLDGAEDAL
ncbi:uncharacterized protein LOC114936479 [Nylanderia fulva]|uniref:uncharacterized protein LOC114936479 n=1 Tax=Nylanderia fulva TaxID=613905 RepID=UPI0010FB9D37|nr:uncharacterized protein LOC114936479 [Nylanderia fulva]